MLLKYTLLLHARNRSSPPPGDHRYHTNFRFTRPISKPFYRLRDRLECCVAKVSLKDGNAQRKWFNSLRSLIFVMLFVVVLVETDPISHITDLTPEYRDGSWPFYLQTCSRTIESCGFRYQKTMRKDSLGSGVVRRK